ncbi:Mpv17 / PMP22 family [Geosmithia morbida]|uniref:Mpv17 / PMP22 family n=1 Tax=Geosmithia morbida TaxID=1094350 RepID=A0A9P4YZS6_9HYPO|nr:Mpv17 / PMP22 family [Geosmithia morbida]KAF4124781.1 Mpv17 / PMP22 family [Geosmithia morbida]
MSPPIVETTLQAALLSVVSNVAAQYIQSNRQGAGLEIDWVPVFQFVLFAMFSTPPNYLWQDWLETTFPSYPDEKSSSSSGEDKKKEEESGGDKTKKGKKKTTNSEAKTEPKLSVVNTGIKLILDQTAGALFNALLFSTFHRSMREALVDAPRETSIIKALGFWNSPGAIDFGRVDWGGVWETSLAELWPTLVAGWKMWPAVSLINFTMVRTVEARNLVGGLAGIAWGTYMSLMVAE